MESGGKRCEGAEEPGVLDTTPMLATICGSAPVAGKIVAAQRDPMLVEACPQPCWLCGTRDNPETIFKPCTCPRVCHRHCFRKWRTGWINPRNYFNCPNCMYNFKLERVRDSAQTKDHIVRNYRLQLLKLWLGTFLFFGGIVAALALFCYACDTRSKNVPVALKWMLTSVVNGVPKGNATVAWMDDFKRPDVHVWPYYTLFAAFLTSIMILIIFCFIGCSFNQQEKRHRGCCKDCCERSDGTWGWYWCYCYDPCPGCNCDCDCSGCSGGDCKCDFGKCDGGGGEAVAIILVVILVVVIVSAVFVVIFYALQKSALLYDRMTHMLLSQQEELEGDTIVLGIDETWRPLDEV